MTYVNKLNSEIPRFDRQKDLGFVRNKMGEIFLGGDKMDEIQNIYNKLVDFKNARGNKEMKFEERDLREKIVNAQLFGYTESTGDFLGFVDRVNNSKRQEINIKNKNLNRTKKVETDYIYFQ